MNASETYQALRTTAATFRLPEHTLIEITGEDRAGYLHRMTTQDIQSMKNGDVRAATICTHKGKLIGELLCAHRENAFWLLCSPGQGEGICNALERYILVDDVHLRDITDDMAMATVQGPNSPAYCAAATGTQAESWTAAFASQVGHQGNAEVFLYAHSRTGERGIDIICPKPNLKPLLDQLDEAGAPLGDPQALDITRIEGGIPKPGVELTEDMVPVEAGMAHTVSYTKGCYTGQEVIAKLKYLGDPPKQVYGIVLPTQSPVPVPGTEILFEGKVVGWVTSAVQSPQLGHPIALAFVKTRVAKKTSVLEIFVEETQYEASLQTLPFYWGTGFELAPETTS